MNDATVKIIFDKVSEIDEHLSSFNMELARDRQSVSPHQNLSPEDDEIIITLLRASCNLYTKVLVPIYRSFPNIDFGEFDDRLEEKTILNMLKTLLSTDLGWSTEQKQKAIESLRNLMVSKNIDPTDS
jgi:hypothetical protein